MVSNVFLRPKPNGQHRLILDLMDLYEYEHFKISFDMMRKDCWMALVDLKDAYYSVPVAQEERKFLRFLWEGQMFQFVALPNGLASVSRIFTKILTPLDAKLRESGHECCPYIDDSFVVADTVEKCQGTVKILCEQLDKLGFIIHTERLVIRLTQNLIFLGFHLDSREMKVCPTEEKRQKLKRAVNHLRNKEVNSIRKVAGLVGLMLSYSPAVQYGSDHVKEVELQKNAALKEAKGNFEQKMRVSGKALTDIKWWVHNIDKTDRDLTMKNPRILIYTDASTEGWGGHREGQTVGGHWLEQEKEEHSNVLELKAILFGLQSLVYEQEVRVGVKTLSGLRH